MTTLQLLRTDFSRGAVLQWVVPFMAVLILGGVLSLVGVGVVDAAHYRLTYAANEKMQAIAYGTTLDVLIENTRHYPACDHAYVDRRLIQYEPGTRTTSRTMLIRERGIANFDMGYRQYHLIMGLPANPAQWPGQWVYTSIQHDNCGLMQSLFSPESGALARWWGYIVSGRDQVAPETPVELVNSPPPLMQHGKEDQ